MSRKSEAGRPRNNPIPPLPENPSERIVIHYRSKKELWGIMDKYGISNEDMAEFIGVTRETLKTWLYNPERGLPVHVMVRLANTPGKDYPNPVRHRRDNHTTYDLYYVLTGHRSREVDRVLRARIKELEARLDNKVTGKGKAMS